MVLDHAELDCSEPDPNRLPNFNLCRNGIRSVEEVAPILNRLATEMCTRGYPRPDAFAVRLALEEAVVNALRHGHRALPDELVQVSYVVADEWVLMEVEDRGPGFIPSLVPDPLADENLAKPSGRGLLLMNHYMSWVRFFGRGNVVTMCRRRSRSRPKS
jgi:serine/threonine-protein kinase RsbW